MKKNILILGFALCCLVLSAVIFAAARQSPAYDPQELDALRQENQELRDRIDELTALLEAAEAGEGLSDWTLDVTPWADSTGADVTMRAVPAAFHEGMEASLLVLLEEQELESIPCVWDGSAFTATANLPAIDGYSYYCILYPANDGLFRIALTTPENPVQDIPVYLASSLTAYCNLRVDTWEENDDSLILTAAHAQAQLPRLSEPDVSVERAQLVLSLNGAEIQRLDIALTPSEVAGSLEASLADTVFSLPETADDDQLSLHLEVTLTTGQQLIAAGVSWYRTGGKLHSVVG